MGVIRRLNWAPSATKHTKGLGIRSWESILTYGRLLHTYGTHANTSVFTGLSYAMMRITSSSEPRRSSGWPLQQECGIVPCVSRRARNGRAFNHPHPVRQSHTRPAGRWLPSHRGSRHTFVANDGLGSEAPSATAGSGAECRDAGRRHCVRPPVPEGVSGWAPHPTPSRKS